MKKLLNCVIQQTLQNRESYSDIRNKDILRNPANPSKPGIVFRYSEPAKENKNKCDYLTRAITLGTTPLSDEELIDFLKHMQIATFGIITVHNNNTHEDDLSHNSLSYFVFLYIN